MQWDCKCPDFDATEGWETSAKRGPKGKADRAVKEFQMRIYGSARALFVIAGRYLSSKNQTLKTKNRKWTAQYG